MITPSSLHDVATTRASFMPDIDPRGHRLMIHGMVDRPLTFTIEDLKRLPLVGSRTGAVTRRRLLGRIGGFPLRARVGVAVVPFPVPAASHAACGFPALRAPAPFTSRVMRPAQPSP